MDKTLLGVLIWVLLLGGLVGFAMALLKLFGGGTPVEYGVLGIGGGFWLLSSAVSIFIRSKLPWREFSDCERVAAGHAAGPGRLIVRHVGGRLVGVMLVAARGARGPDGDARETLAKQGCWIWLP
jgi:hypothetical protein